MNLGYLSIPRHSAPDATLRAEMARELGFSEFYTVGPQGCASTLTAFNTLPESAAALRVLSDFPRKRPPQVVAIDGERQFPDDVAASLNLAYPSVAAEQVMANAQQKQATLSVSWLNKADLAKHWAAQVTGSTHAGLRARPEDWRIARTILVSNDEARVEAAVKSEDSPCRAYYANIAGTGAAPADVEALMEACVLRGPLQSVLEELHDISTLSGPFGTLTLVDHAWPDEDLAQQSLATLAEAIAPITQRNRASV